MSESLFQISQEMQELDRQLDESDHETYAEQIAAYRKTLNDRFADKVGHLANYVKDLDARATAQQERAKELNRLAEINANKSASIRRMMFDIMSESGINKLEGDWGRVSIVNNGGKLPLIKPDDVESLDPPYRSVVTKWVADTDKIRSDIESGVEVKGCKLGERRKRLSIK